MATGRGDGTGRPETPPRGILGWLLFDCATQPFFTLVTTFVFAPYFVAAVAPDPVSGQAWWGYATGAAGLLIALTAPLAGAVADAAGPRKPFVIGFGLMMALAASALWWTAPGTPHAVAIALVAFAVGTVGVEYATVFNNAMMPDLVPPERLGRLSGRGWAIGYVGGLVSLAATLALMAASPETGRTLAGLDPILGLDPATRAGDRASGPFSALWFCLFILPFVLWTPDRPRSGRPLGAAVRGAAGTLRGTLAELGHHPAAARFLIANMIYTDGLIALFAFGGVYAAGAFGWTTVEIGVFGILLTVTGTIGALAGGRLDDRLGPKAVVTGSLALLTLAALGILGTTRDTVLFVLPAAGPVPGDGLWASLPEKVYVALGCLIGLAAGPVQAASRTLLCRLAPPDRTAQFFGLFALTGKITSFMGPIMVGLATDLSGSQRLGVAPLVAFFVVGAVLLAGVRTPR
ncbi:MFS transporter [Oharaeibacter diazotrophicus]|uniref:UMF1 family MFS transporter n=1 Tax=Oharaeibacter diazotrophicus TaxID=1920512 RepID=A0A4R6RED6_9HYPH|nr:MFS transporter [Oharaeibacter diazotrophicus]TDP84036.1 UMF1 family MFS transporter [Oharaeibacter diazotrophicus]BBE73075.1 vacuole effluxer Atg22 like protein [Pleomorphomonas sp. SM30]GLS74863.1 MFS transporter [Oharaeibacter diazotrophicus]